MGTVTIILLLVQSFLFGQQLCYLNFSNEVALVTKIA